MARKRFADASETGAVKQAIARGYPVAEVPGDRAFEPPPVRLASWAECRPRCRKARKDAGLAEELTRPPAWRRRVGEERDIPEKAAAYLARKQGHGAP